MGKFILLTFGFLGWAFYEMSDGPDFQPASVRMAAATPAVEEVAPQKAKAEVPAPKVAKIVPVDTTPPGYGKNTQDQQVSRVALNLTTVRNAAVITNASLVTNASYVPINAGSMSSTENTPAIIPSLIVPGDSGAVSSDTASYGEIRSVSGNRVNVRGGPGTDYGVVTKLERGASVEILADNGDGWVKMRPLNGGPEGWMADFLLTNG